MILLTGSNGFLGSRLLARFLDEGEDVVGIKRSFSDTSRIAAWLGHPRLRMVDVDLSDPETVFAEHPIDTIVHAATQYGRQSTPLYAILEANLILPLRLAELGKRYGTRCFLNTDSYFNKANHSYSNLLDYALSKKSLLTWLDKLSDSLQIVNIVLEHIYGPHDSPSKFVESLVQRVGVLRAEHVAMTHGHQRRDFVYIDDVVDAYVRLLAYGRQSNFRFRTFEVGTGKSLPVRDFALAIKSLSGSPTTLGFGDVEYRSDEIMNSVADVSPLAELGWRAKTTHLEGIAAILRTYRVDVLSDLTR